MLRLGDSKQQRNKSTLSRRPRNDGRAQSVVIGTILVFALGILLLAVLQVTLVPQNNEDVEAQHSQEIRGQMQDLRNDIQRSSSTGDDFSRSLTLGTDYPPRAFFLNPGPAQGSIRTEGTQTSSVKVEIRNAEATRNETVDFWDGSVRDYGTGAVVYEPNYNVYQNAPDKVTIENSLVYNRFDGRAILKSNQQLVDGREISLVTLDGQLSQARVDQYTVDVEGVSGSSTAIPVEDTGSNIEIEISTQLSEEEIVTNVLSGQIDDSGDPAGTAGLDSGDTTCGDIQSDPSNDNERYISGCSFTTGSQFNTLTLEFEQGETYTLELSKIGVGSGYSSTSAEYITEIKGEGAAVAETGTQNVVVEVRDGFNNPIAGREVELSLPNPGDGDLGAPGQDTVTRRTDEQGQVEVTYIAPSKVTSSPRDVEIEATYDLDDGFDSEGEPDDALIQLRAINGSQVDRTAPLVNPTTLKLEDALIRDDSSEGETCTGNVPCTVDVTFSDSSDSDTEDVVIEEIRYSFYSSDASGTSPITNKGQVEFVTGGVTLEFAGEFDDSVNVVIPDDSSKQLRFKFKDESGTPTEVDEGDFFVISFVIDGERVTYFIPPVDDP